MYGDVDGRYVLACSVTGGWHGRWDSLGDAEAHLGEAMTMDPEADLEIIDLDDLTL